MNRRTILFAMFLLSPIITFAQSDIKKMLKDINGKVDEIIIKSEGKEFTFSGDEAAKLFSAMKKDKEVKSFSFTTKDGKVFTEDSLTKKIIIKNLDDDTEDNVLVFIDEDFDSDDTEIKTIEKKVIVSGESNKKVVKVTTKEDGKENIEIYEGKAADEYLEKMKSEKEIEVNVDVNEEDGKKVKKIIIEKEVDKK
jgi:hypothetical protein